MCPSYFFSEIASLKFKRTNMNPPLFEVAGGCLTGFVHSLDDFGVAVCEVERVAGDSQSVRPAASAGQFENFDVARWRCHPANTRRNSAGVALTVLRPVDVSSAATKCVGRCHDTCCHLTF